MKQAADLYKPLCDEFPINGHLNTIAGACYYATGELDLAKKYLQKAVKLLEPGDNDRDLAERLLKNLK
jgi:tetratricopeptide (TPR) repeat protein